jgi:hypothetical protein
VNKLSMLQALRDADPAVGAEPALNADALAARISRGDDATLDARQLRGTRPAGRWIAIVAAAAAVAVAIPILWPGAESPIPAPSAFAIDEDNGAVTITIPLNENVSAAMFRAALAKAHLDAAVFETTASCTELPQDGLPVDDFFVATPPVNDVLRVTFHPASKPAGTKLVFALETVGGAGTAVSWWLTDHLPGCVPLSITTYPIGSAGPSGPPLTTG